jgi:restriction system protein
MTKIPTYDSLMNPMLKALRLLGGSGSVEEINNRVVEIAEITDEQLEIPHNEKDARSEVEYRLAWTRTYLKEYGLLENSSRGVWALTREGGKTESVDSKEVVHVVREKMRLKGKEKPDSYHEEEIVGELEWQEELMKVLLKMEPSAFERLIQRMLRESGFTQVEVTGRTGDGGIDGRGIMRLSGLLSFHVIFQCKRWQGSVGANHVRDFRGAMVGRADKGLLITTGTFTQDAIREATRDGAPAIDLIDGDQLLEKLKELSLGVTTERIEVEEVIIDTNWFLNI